jgi:uncharacterized protein (TIGR03382 family)
MRQFVIRRHVALLVSALVVASCEGQSASSSAGSAGRSATAAGLDPAWRPVAPMATARERHTATLLPSGGVLVAGGFDGSGSSIATSELYYPARDTWTSSGAMATARSGHTATPLSSGKVLVTGGSSNGSLVGTAELFDPATASWAQAGHLVVARTDHSASLLASGQVLLVGGRTGDGTSAAAELFDPATGTSTAVAPLSHERWGHTATLLPSGSVLVAGGRDKSDVDLVTAELFDPATRGWTTAASMKYGRKNHTATLLRSGAVLVAGGYDDGAVEQAELYDSSGTWTVTGAMAASRYRHQAVLLSSGKVLVAAGAKSGTDDTAAGGTDTAAAELYDPATGAWRATATLALARRWHTATILPSGSVLVAGGSHSASAEIYDPMDSALTVCPLSAEVAPRAAIAFVAAGGSGAGYRWSLALDGSGGSVDPVTGAYVAGATGGVSDVVQVVDSSGNVAAATVKVTEALSVSPATASVAPGASRSFTAHGGSSGGYVWSLAANASGGSIDSTGTYTAGALDHVIDRVQVTDSVGNVAFATVSVGDELVVTSGSSVPPRGTLQLTASGGTGTGLVWSLETNASGATIAGDMYQAGAQGEVVDVARVTDSAGNTATHSITVTRGVSITVPGGSTVAPEARHALIATGGSGTGYRWSLLTNVSAGSIDANTGEYASGSTGGGADDVQVVDSLGNVATAQVTVAPWRLEGSGGCSSGGGGGAWTLVLVGAAALLGRRRGRQGPSSRARAAALTLTLTLLGPATARAGGFTNERLQPAAGAHDILGVESALVSPHLAPHAAAYLSYADEPLRLKAAGSERPYLPGQTTLTLGASLGLFDRFELSLALPFSVQRTGRSGLRAAAASTFSSSGIGDVLLVPKARVYAGSRFFAAIAAPITLPTGDSDSYLGQGSATVSPRLIVELQVARGLRLAGNAGFTLRRSSEQLELKVGSAVTYAVGAEAPFRLAGQRMSAVATFAGETQLNASGGDPGLEALAGVSWHGPLGMAVTIGGGPGLSHAYGTPRYRVLTAVTFGGATGDARAAPQDLAAHEPPSVPVVEPPVVAVSVVPDKPAAPLDEGARLLGTIHFDFDKAGLRADAMPVLDNIVAEVRAQPSLHLYIEGHADRRGPEAYNQVLSERRARAVRDALAKKGVAMDRMQLRGFGESKPLDPAHNLKAYARNRRVEVRQEAAATARTDP